MLFWNFDKFKLKMSWLDHMKGFYYNKVNFNKILLQIELSKLVSFILQNALYITVLSIFKGALS